MRSMTEEEAKLARELAAEPAWSWHAGQEYVVDGTPLSHVRTRLLAERPNGKWVQYTSATKTTYDNYHTGVIIKNAIPNLADPITVDSLLTVARTACGGDIDFVYIDNPDEEPFWATSYMLPTDRVFPPDGPTFAEAILQLLREVTSRAFDAASAAGAANKAMVAALDVKSSPTLESLLSRAIPDDEHPTFIYGGQPLPVTGTVLLLDHRSEPGRLALLQSEITANSLQISNWYPKPISDGATGYRYRFSVHNGVDSFAFGYARDIKKKDTKKRGGGGKAE